MAAAHTTTNPAPAGESEAAVSDFTSTLKAGDVFVANLTDLIGVAGAPAGIDKVDVRVIDPDVRLAAVRGFGPLAGITVGYRADASDASVSGGAIHRDGLVVFAGSVR